MSSNAGTNGLPAFLIAVWAGFVGVADRCPAAADGSLETRLATGVGAGDGLFDRLDTNWDGQVTVDEVAPEHRPLFERLLRTSDKNRDGRLNRIELASGLTPSTPDKPIAPPKSAELAGAKFGRLLLLKLDADRDSRLTRDEAPAGLRGAFDRIAENADRNNDGVIDRPELNRSGPRAAGVGRRFAKREGWDVDAELARLEREQGRAVYRFDEPIGPGEALADPQQARQLFGRLDTDGDQRLTREELPEPVRERFEPLFRRADANRDGSLSRKEYLEASQRLARYLQRTGLAAPKPGRPAKKQPRKAKKAPQQSEPKRDGQPPTRESVAERLMRKRIARADRNGDGRLTRGETTGPMLRRFDQADLNNDGVLDADELAEATRRLDKKLRAADQNAAKNLPRRGE